MIRQQSRRMMTKVLEKNNANINKEHKKSHVQNYLEILVKPFINCKIKAENLLIFLRSRECGKG